MNQIEYLYSQNRKIKLLPLNLKKNNETDLVNDYSKKLNLEILKVGFESRINQKLPFYKSFYNQLGLRYNISYKYFFCPSDSQKEDELYSHLTSLFKIKRNDYILVHDEASNEKCELEIDSDKDVISLSSEYDIFNNIFLYKKLVLNASEIHCINSSFAHLVDRSITNGKKFYHNIRGGKLKFKKKWKYIEYKN